MTAPTDPRLDDKSPAPELARAEQCDAAGRHYDAVNELARAAQRGDVEATTRLAKRLIVGDRAPLLPRDGVALLRQAAQGGGAEAAGRLAVLVAAGLNGHQDWPAALELLVHAAERGWQPARDQLGVLSSPSPGDGPDPSSTRRWRQLAAAVDVASWHVAPAGTTLHESPLIRALPSFVSEAVCSWLVERSRGKLTRALVYDPAKKVDIIDKTRTNSSAGFNLMEADLVHLMVQTRMGAACGYPIAHFEGPAVLHYSEGEMISDHFDFVDPAMPSYAEEIRTNGQRVITFLVYLNAGYAGGETEFPKLDLRHKGALAEGLFFVNSLPSQEPDLRALHAGRPPTSGEKWIFSQFIRDRAVLRFA